MSQIKYKIMKLAKKTNENIYIGKVNEENANQNMIICGLDYNLAKLKEIVNHLTHNCHMVKCTLGIAIKIKI